MSKNENRSPHIVHFSSVHPLGDIRIFHKQCRSLAKAGYKTTLIARGDSSDSMDGVTRIAVPRRESGGRIVRMLLDTLKVSKLAWNQKADLYLFHDPELILVGLVFRLFGKKIIYDAHEDYRDDIMSKGYIHEKLRRVISAVFGCLEDFAKRRYTAILTATPRIAETLSTDHTLVINNYPLSEEVSLNTGSSLRDPNTVIYAGAMSSERGIQEMVDAIGLANRRQSARLILCGTIPLAMYRDLEKRDGWQYVDALGFQERAQMFELFSSSTCGILAFHPVPNHVEAMPNKLFEYMAAGLPVVASNFPFWKQFVQDVGSGVMVDPMDPEDIADGILEIINDPERARQMGEAGAKAVRERFSWDSEARKLLDLVSRLIGDPKSAGESRS